MSEISFSASLDTKLLDEQIKKSNITIKDWVKGIEDGSIKMDQAVEKTVAQQKEAIKQQKLFIKGLIAEIKELERAFEKAGAGGGKRDAGNDLKRAQQGLVEARADLNRLQNETISQNKEEETTQGRVIESIKKWGMGLLTITGAIKVFKAIVASSNVLTEEFGFAVDGAKGALQQFFQIFSAGLNQTGNPIANMIKGFKGAKELAENIDSYNDAMRANHVLEAQEIETLKQKETIFRNASNSAKQRETALNDWIAIRKEAAARELKIEQDLNTSLLNEVKNRPNLKGITDSEIGNFVTMYATNPQLMNKAEEMAKILSGMASWDTEAKFKKLKGEIEALLPVGITYESLMSSIRLNSALSGKQIDALSNSYRQLATAQGGGATVEAESARWLGSIINKAEAADKKLNDLKTQIDTLTTSLATAGESERKGIADKIILLEKELKLQQDIVNAALMSATIREKPLSKITGLKTSALLPGGLKTPNTLAGKPTFDSGDYIPGTAMLSDQGWVNQKKNSDKYDKDAEEAIKKQLDLRNKIVQSVTDLVSQIGQQIGLDEKSMSLLNAGLDAFTQLASGDIVGAAISMLSGIIAQIPSAASRFEAEIEHINQLLEKQQRLIDQSEQKGGQAAAREGGISGLEIKAAAQKAEYERLQKSAEKHLDLLGWRQDKADEAYATWQATTVEIEDSNQALTDFYTNTTASAVADAIILGFQNGETSAADFADTFNGFMMQAIDAALKDSLLIDLRPWYEQFKINMADGLSEEEKAQLKLQYDEIIAIGKADRDAMYGVAGISPTSGGTGSKPGLSGQIRAMSETTGSELSGLFRRFADEQGVVKDYSILGVAHLVGIEANTYNTTEELKTANKSLEKAVSNLEKISGNTKQNLEGVL